MLALPHTLGCSRSIFQQTSPSADQSSVPHQGDETWTESDARLAQTPCHQIPSGQHRHTSQICNSCVCVCMGDGGDKHTLITMEGGEGQRGERGKEGRREERGRRKGKPWGRGGLSHPPTPTHTPHTNTHTHTHTHTHTLTHLPPPGSLQLQSDPVAHHCERTWQPPLMSCQSDLSPGGT